MRVPKRATSDDRESSSSDNISNVALLVLGNIQKDPLVANNKPKIDSYKFFSWFHFS